MKRQLTQLMISVLAISILATLGIWGCGGKSAEYAAKGALGGAVSASFVGAVTDLIVDGRVNTYRLERNIVAGAVAGGTAGAIAGSKVPADPPPAESSPKKNGRDEAYDQLERDVGPENMKGLEMLVFCDHQGAFSTGLNTEKSDDPGYSEAGLILQILTDHDRGNTEGVDRGLDKLLTTNDQIGTMGQARQELDNLWTALKDERRIQGRAPTCKG